MPQPSSQNLIAGLDPTSLIAITPSQLLQMIQAANPYTDKGMLVFTSDVGGIPTVPDGAGTPLWQRYMWIRIMAGGVIAYVWNANGVSDATYQKWVSITVAGIADGSIITSKLADLAVTNQKITSVDWTKITNIPALVNAATAAGGDLAGLYPNPTIGANKVDRTKLQSDAAVDANRAVGTDHLQDSAVKTAKINDLAVTIAKINFGTSLQRLRTNLAGNAVEWATNGVDFLGGEQAVPAANTLIIWAHGLTTVPSYHKVVLICKTAELGYSIGDEIDLLGAIVLQDNNQAWYRAAQVGADAVNVFAMVLGNKPIDITPKNLAGGAASDPTVITKANWKIKCYASK